MVLARTIRELYENCNTDIRKIFHHLTHGKVHGDPFEDLVSSFYLAVWKSNMFRGGFEFGVPEAEACFTPYVFTFARRFHRNYCRQMFGRKIQVVDERTGEVTWRGSKMDGWTNTSTIRDHKGNDVDVFGVAVGANHSDLCAAHSVATTGGFDYLWGQPDPHGSFRLDDYRKVLMRSLDLRPDEKLVVSDLLEKLHGGMEMSEVAAQSKDKSNAYRLRRQARNILKRYQLGHTR